MTRLKALKNLLLNEQTPHEEKAKKKFQLARVIAEEQYPNNSNDSEKQN